MPDTNIGNADYSAMTSTMSDWSVVPKELDTGDKTKEYAWQMEDWQKWLGYYKSIPELQTAIDAKANWTMGAGFEADEITTLILMNVVGHGKDTFNSVLSNMIRTYTIAGDAFAEIISTDEGHLTNLKPLDPSTIRIVYSKQGIITRYEQTAKIGGKALHKFKPEQILHLSRKRLANEIHGISIIPAVEWIIQARNEAMTDWKKVLHRNVQPLWIFHLDTDDTSEIASFKAKMDSARGSGENMYIPKGAVVPELVATATNASLNPLSWLQQLNDYFFQAVNVPQIIIGNAKEFTDASGKIVYLSFEQSVKGEQLYIEEQVLNQLNLEIELTVPASLQNELLSSQEQDKGMQAAQPNDVMAEMEGRT
jgi:hypothetical protein